jgi:hypothetical protein
MFEYYPLNWIEASDSEDPVSVSLGREQCTLGKLVQPVAPVIGREFGLERAQELEPERLPSERSTAPGRACHGHCFIPGVQQDRAIYAVVPGT